MLLFFICWLYLIPSLLFPLTEQGGSYSRPNLSHFFGCLGLVLIYIVVEVCVAVQSLCIFMWVLFGVLKDCLYIVSDSVWSLQISVNVLLPLWIHPQIHSTEGLCDDEPSSEERMYSSSRILMNYICTSIIGFHLLKAKLHDCPWLVRMIDSYDKRLTEQMRFNINGPFSVLC